MSAIHLKTQQYFLNIFIYLMSMIISVFTISIFMNVDLKLVIHELWQTPFMASKNTNLLLPKSEINPLAVHYLAVYFSILPLLIMCKLKNKSIFGNRILLENLKNQILLIIVGVIIFQSIWCFNFYEREAKWYYKKSTEEIIMSKFKNVYQFAQFSKKHLPGKHICKPITDITNDRQRGLLTYLALRYYLYPINIVTYQSYNTFDCELVILKDDPESFVSAPFSIIKKFDSKSLMAIKEGLAHDHF